MGDNDSNDPRYRSRKLKNIIQNVRYDPADDFPDIPFPVRIYYAKDGKQYLKCADAFKYLRK